MVDKTSPVPANEGYADLHEHIRRLDAAGLLYRIDTPVNKDTEMHPLVRWQFRGGIPEADRKAFLFTNIVDSKGRRYDIPVIVGGIAANPEIYRIGMGVPDVADIGAAWNKAISNPIPPVLVEHGPVHDIIIQGKDLEGPGNGLESLPLPISTPGFDAAPYMTMTGVISRDPETGIQNMGTYRGHLKSATRLGMMMLVNLRAGGLDHWRKNAAAGERMPVAIVLGAPPVVAFQGPQKLRPGVDELGVAGGLAGEAIRVVKGVTVDLLVPAEAEVIVEGYVDPTYLEPEGPFGESHGYVALDDYNLVIEVTAITRRKDAVLTSIISQVTPSESSVIKRLAYEPLYLSHLRDHLGIKGIQKVYLHEPLTNLRRFVFLQFKAGSARSEIWRALYGTMSLQAAIGKYVIAVDQDIDPDNADAIFWAMGYRCNPAEDIRIIDYREQGHGPRSDEGPRLDSAMLVDATMKSPMPPLALPKKEYMEQAKAMWDKLGLPPLKPEMPWYGYTLGDWTDEWDRNAKQATEGEWMQRDAAYQARKRTGVEPNTPVRGIEGKRDDPQA